jgi:hypothetical protein
MTTSSVVGRSKPGCGLSPTPSFKDLHHPCCGGGRAESGFYLPHGPAGRLFLQHSGQRALTGLVEGANFDNVGPVGRKRRQLQRAWLAGSAGSVAASNAASCRLIRAWPSVHRMGDCCAVRTGGSSKTSYPAGRMGGVRVVGLSCPHSGTTPPRGGRCLPVREDLSGDLPVQAGVAAIHWRSSGAQVVVVVGAEVVVARGGFSADETVGATRGQTSGSLALIACPCPSSGDVGEGLLTSAFALRSSLLLFSRPRRRSLLLLVRWSPASHLEFVVPQALWCGGCSYPREWNRSPVCNGNLSMGVCSLWLSRPEHLGI